MVYVEGPLGIEVFHQFGEIGQRAGQSLSLCYVDGELLAYQNEALWRQKARRPQQPSHFHAGSVFSRRSEGECVISLAIKTDQRKTSNTKRQNCHGRFGQGVLPYVSAPI